MRDQCRGVLLLINKIINRLNMLSSANISDPCVKLEMESALSRGLGFTKGEQKS